MGLHWCVQIRLFDNLRPANTLLFANTGNYDITKLHYEGPGDVPGATVGEGYGYDVRTEQTTVAA